MESRRIHQQLGLQQLKLETDGTQVVAKQEIGVLEGELVSLAFGLRAGRHMLGRARIDFRFREYALWWFWFCHIGERA